MRDTRTSSVAMATIGLLTGVAGCGGSGGVLVPPGSEGLAPCPMREIAIEDLREIGEPGCDLVGSTLVFPDGVSVPISAVGAAFSYSESAPTTREYILTNWGVPGVGAYSLHRDGAHGPWASTDEAERLQREAAELDGVTLD